MQQKKVKVLGCTSRAQPLHLSLTKTLSPFAESRTIGNRTSDAATKFKVSCGRVSQLRRELAKSWRAFLGEEPVTEAA